ncbi:hypothetical protein G7Y89_g11185 [Cudoniella acicularis]|uniref:WLM domain-containing protein n=1 Tax=Cudoniella acicularis TaxID=354080 RepID=A0A8H4RBB4_9HELO|nr:hypothetical protein G7Y89_g11185 [Cudoniella acicularis]
MPEHDALVLEYSHLKKLPREAEALQSLKKIASLVKPIMRARSWKVGVLAEFYPDQQNLLGINQNRGQKICLRLRYPGDVTQFLPLEQVVDTMLHELAHNVHGPHNADFMALWDQQRKEYEALIAKGYTGEGFLSDGHKLGGGRIPMHEARRLARVAAEKRATLYSGSGQKLGGRPVRAGTDIRKVILDAIERRSTVLKGCGSSNKNDDEIQVLADQATRNGFKTQAEEDEANDRAIAQAMWELVQEDQKKEYGDSYIPSTAANPTGNGGGEVGASKPVKAEPSRAAAQRNPAPKREPPRHVSRLVTESAAKKSKPLPKKVESILAPDPPSPPTTAPEPVMTGWTCDVSLIMVGSAHKSYPATRHPAIGEELRTSHKTMANLIPLEAPVSKLRAMLANEDEIIVFPGVYDGFTARLALNAGLKSYTWSSYVSMPASQHVTNPFIYPFLSTSYSNSPRGNSIHLEDHAVTKRCGHLSNKQLVSPSEFTSRVLAIFTMRRQLSRDILIIARTDALAAFSRLRLAITSGADITFLEGVRSVSEAKQFCANMKELGLPALYNCVPGGVGPVWNVEEAREIGYRMVITQRWRWGGVYEAVGRAYTSFFGEGGYEGEWCRGKDVV